MKKLIFTLALFGTLSAAQSATVGEYAILDLACKNHEQELITKMSEELEKAEQFLPNITPEEEKYINAESAAIRRIQQDKSKGYDRTAIEKRYLKLTSRPMYKVSKVRLALLKLRTSVKKIESKDFNNVYFHKSSEADKLHRAIYAVNEVSTYMTEISEFVQISTSAGTLDQQLLELYSETLLMPGNLQDFMNCKLQKLMFVP